MNLKKSSKPLKLSVIFLHIFSMYKKKSKPLMKHVIHTLSELRKYSCLYWGKFFQSFFFRNKPTGHKKKPLMQQLNKMNEIKKKFPNPQKPNKKENLWCGTMLLIIVKWKKLLCRLIALGQLGIPVRLYDIYVTIVHRPWGLYRYDFLYCYIYVHTVNLMNFWSNCNYFLTTSYLPFFQCI